MSKKIHIKEVEKYCNENGYYIGEYWIPNKTKMINKWKNLLSINNWTFIVESIDPDAVMYDDDCPIEDRYYIGIEPNHDTKTATIYHNRPLTERDIIHELLHIRYPKWGEDQINEVEELLYKLNQNKDENNI